MKPVFRRWVLIPTILVVPVVLAVVMSSMKPEPEQHEDETLDLLVEVLRLEISALTVVCVLGRTVPWL